MKFASVAQAKNHLSQLLGEAHKTQETILITNHGKPYAILHPVTSEDIETLDWQRLAETSLQRAWQDEPHDLRDYSINKPLQQKLRKGSKAARQRKGRLI